MYKRRFELSSIGVITSLVTLIFLIVKMILGTKDLLIPIVFVIAYTAYIFPIMVREYKSCKMDKDNGLEEAILELYDVKITGKNSRFYQPLLPLVTFKGEGKYNYVTLSGDFTKVEMIKGKKYKVVFCKNSKMIASIESI